MEIVKTSNVMESFGLISVEKGFFAEIDELELTDVIGGSCGAGSSICITKINCSMCYGTCYGTIFSPSPCSCRGACYIPISTFGG